MKKIIYTNLILVFIISLCFAKKDSVVLVPDPYTIEDVKKLEASYLSGKTSAIEQLISIAKDKNQVLYVRMESLNILSSSEHPMLETALKDIIGHAEFVDLEIMSKTIEMLLSFENLSSSKELTQALLNSEHKIMNFREEIIEAIGKNNTQDKIVSLIELYDISLQNHQRMNELLTLTLGEMDNLKAIPMLMKIAQDDTVDLKIRNRAIEILSRKNAPELVDFFINILGNPGSNDQMLNFINNSMGIEQQDRLLLAMLESYQTGKNRYHAVLYSVMESLEDFSNPNVKPVFIDVAITDGYPMNIRIKAINALANFKDETVLEELIPILEYSNNYEYYYEIKNLANTLNASEKYHQKIRKAGYSAMQK